MNIVTINLAINIVLLLAICAMLVYLVFLLIKALKKYIKSEPVRKEKAESAKSLGEVLKRHRTECKMTQEFVAETLGVSRQAVSKWESGLSDPSTTNLMALAKLFNMTPEDLLKEAQ
ncbi:helix-turn-helix domain-containing protein [Frisingicoccus caecimuris]|uniref:DNA-binding XRE family transcriptional regulator n=1 Tax=Frisingicoccus caecimuris TaxID=1796636 RepID=A0A4R2LFH2_9FIRM|nr:helix-turn-helix transcriptional regulator [Frisingicoccus caecimuris]MCR1919576.1 helix-turn-helix domain-containing protein [Frisingicoccus caecimuris]MCZ1091039.1 helix-turn-helix transcriptional regulator [Clostridioides difficile]MDI6389513.1 helix-turn-helix transcriptional regulator [Clostridioides difficile]TCO83527.1 DNA-binding XRE family transcriptional regulator [Frisingicoccus caecimuris]